MITLRASRFLPLLASCTLGFAAGPVFAAPLTAQQTLNQFNLITLGNTTSSSHVDGRSFIGGNLTGYGANFVQNASGTPASDYAGLTVGGSASGAMVNGLGAVVQGNLSNSTVNSGSSVVFGNANGVNFDGPAYVGGSATSVNFNGGQNPTLATGTAATAANSTNFSQVLTGLSAQLSHLSSTGSTWSIASNTTTFNAVTNSNGVAVFDLTGSTAWANPGQFQFNLNGATTVIFNTDATSASIAANFLGGSAQAIGAETIWNFYKASDLTINNQFGGSILAPLATMTNNQNIEGGVYVNTLNQNGEIHLQPFSGNISPVPEPRTYAMLLAGLGLIGFIAKRKQEGRAGSINFA